MNKEAPSPFNLISPTDYRYSVKELEQYLSEEAFVKYKAKIEGVLTKTFAKYGICTPKIAGEVVQATSQIMASDVYKEESKIKHEIKALVNVILDRVSDEAKPFVHTTATSYDIVDTANALRYRDATKNIILPDMVKLEKLWIDLAKREKDTIQIGRTHGQHAEPITFGFAIAQYVNRWGNRILNLKTTTDNLVGKFSGAVGAYNASSLLFEDPESFERDFLDEGLGLKPAEISTQIIPPEGVTDFIHSIISSFGVLANFARDMRNLQRSEIGEVGEPFEEDQVGSSTMPQKRNPINFENVESMWIKFMPHIVTMYLNQISEHQRDLTNSCSQRYTPELLMAFDSSVRRMNRVCNNLQVDRENMKKNFELNEDKIIAEPLYVLLAFHGHPNAHEYVRKLIMTSYQTGKSLPEIALSDKELQSYLKKFSNMQLEVISTPSKYVGIAAEKTEKVTLLWEKRLKKAKLW
ncbi:adenylosuccinate lyase [Candidatus Bathyarchaeota archaeon]|nr:adenylosuccinate lyase [Candidatus Bathyarchaeota archaeon]